MITAYPVRGKRKSLEICSAFVAGCRGAVDDSLLALKDGPAVFYGVDDSNAHIWEKARARGSFWYIDNAYFDQCRQRYFRITKDRLQHSGIGSSDGKRWKSLGMKTKPWRTSGSHIILCPQSPQFMRVVCGFSSLWADDWAGLVCREITSQSKRPLRIREWSANKGALASSLIHDLKDAWVLVTWSSAAAITAIIEGVPAITMGQCAAEPMAGKISAVESPPTPDGREEWAAVLADNQFTMDEMKNGYAWASLQ